MGGLFEAGLEFIEVGVALAVGRPAIGAGFLIAAADVGLGDLADFVEGEGDRLACAALENVGAQGLGLGAGLLAGLGGLVGFFAGCGLGRRECGFGGGSRFTNGRICGLPGHGGLRQVV